MRDRFGHLALLLALCSCLHALHVVHVFYRRVWLHRRLSRESPEYARLGVGEQLRRSVGRWFLVDMAAAGLGTIVSVYACLPSSMESQFPSVSSVEALGMWWAVSVIRFSQWLSAHPPFYQVIIIWRDGGGKLFNLVVSILPIVTAFAVCGVWIFAFVDETFQTFRYVVQRFVSSGMGDSIDDFFIVTDSPGEFLSVVSFVYVAAVTAAGMWIVFTACIATVEYVHETRVLRSDEFWRQPAEEAEGQLSSSDRGMSEATLMESDATGA